MYKNKIRALVAGIMLALVSAVALFFVVCNDNENTNRPSYVKSEITNIPDGEYVGHIGNHRVVDTWRENQLVFRTIDGVQDNTFKQRSQQIFFGKDCDIRSSAYADKLVEHGCPCVTILHTEHFNGTDMYIVEYSALESDGSCWYDKYEDE